MKTTVCVTVWAVFATAFAATVQAGQKTIYELVLTDQKVGAELSKQELHCDQLKTTDRNKVGVGQDVGGLHGKCLLLTHDEPVHDSPTIYWPLGKISAGQMCIEFDAVLTSSRPGPQFPGAETLLSFALLDERGQYRWGLQYVNTSKTGEQGLFSGEGLKDKKIAWHVGSPSHFRLDIDLDHNACTLHIDDQIVYENLPIEFGAGKQAVRLLTIRDGVTLGGRDGLYTAAIQNLRVTLDAPDQPAAAASEKPPVEITKLMGPSLGNLLLDKDVLQEDSKPVAFQFQIQNNKTDAPVPCTYQAALSDDHGQVLAIPSTPVQVPAGGATPCTISFRPPGYGFFSLRIEVAAAGQTQSATSSLCVLHPPHEGVRPNSMFGLGIGDTPNDRQIASIIGVKWRRGIPFTNPTDVSPAPGEYWQKPAIDRARRAIQDWKDAGVLCLGYVNYNLPWNIEPDPLGRKIYPHQNRPKDMAAHVEMVHHLIAPLSDLVKHWELWNEPWVHSWTWRTGTAQDYRDMTRMIWDRIKPDMPDIQLIGGGSTPYARDVVFARGSKNTGYVDGLTNHPYGPPDNNTPCCAALDSYMLSHWAKGKGQGGLWYTEVGTGEMYFKDMPAADRPYMVARSLAPIYILNKLGAGRNDIKLFAFASQFNRRFSGDVFNWWDGVQPKPVVAAYSAMTYLLEDAAPVDDLLSASKIGWAVLFKREDGTSIVVFWPGQGTDGQMSLPALDFQTYDYLGRPIGQISDGRLSFPIRTWEVRYLCSHQPQDQIRAAFSQLRMKDVPALAINPRSFVAPLDAKPSLRISVRNLLPQTVDAQLDITPPNDIQLATSHATINDLKPGEQRLIEFPIASGQPNAINRYPISYKAAADGVEQSGTQTVQVACATFGTPDIDGDLSDWADAIPVTMLSRGGTDFLRIALNPDLAAQLLAQPQPTGTAAYRLWMRFDESHLYLAAEIPDSTLTTNSTFEDDPYSFPFNADNIQFAFNCDAKHADDLLRDSSLYEKSCAADVDYEFCATLARLTHDGPWFAQRPAWKGDWSTTPRIPQLHRLLAPGTNFQTYYATNAPMTPPLGAMQATPAGGPEGRIAIVYDDARHVFRYEMAIPWSCISDLQKQVAALSPGQGMTTHFAWAVTDAGGRGKTFWQDEAGDVEAGSYGFSPRWGGGNSSMGGRIITDWGFYRRK